MSLNRRRLLVMGSWAFLTASCVSFQDAPPKLDGASPQVEFEKLTSSMKTPCKSDRDCEFVPLDGPCCVCGLARSKRSRHPLDRTRLEALCQEMSLQMDDEDLVGCDCESDAPPVKCLDGSCQI
jgi:hypothetical protein